MYIILDTCIYTVEPPNNGHFGDEHFVHCCPFFGGRNVNVGGRQFIHCREVVHFSDCSLSEVPLYPQSALCPLQLSTCLPFTTLCHCHTYSALCIDDAYRNSVSFPLPPSATHIEYSITRTFSHCWQSSHLQRSTQSVCS